MINFKSLSSVNCCIFYFITDGDVPIHLSVILRKTINK